MDNTTPNLGRGNSFEIGPEVSAQGLTPELLMGAIRKPMQDAQDAREKKDAPKKVSQQALVLSKAQLAEILEAQVEKQLKRFKEAHNKTTTSRFVDTKLIWVIKPTPESTTYSSVIRLEFHLSVDGAWNLAYGKTFGFNMADEEKDQGHAKLTLLDDLLYNLVGGGVMYSILKLDTKNNNHE